MGLSLSGLLRPVVYSVTTQPSFAVALHNKWLVDSKSTLIALENIDCVPWDLRNMWLNCRSFLITIRWSHIYREGNSCADKLANLGHSFAQFKWWDSLPLELQDDFLRDKLGLPCSRFA
ncbi:hypothetical protein TSUD_180300 [Trifolium subterraneum]|uniref:RNase H type-1 domain-containing protein n=1 Tax=Trifolium subterraneum TaxID=3900 RepID=A0A2Z6PHE5_TRISU|nr:hypothetical protein TSUD_180300 [Trifolium subterraneum]